METSSSLLDDAITRVLRDLSHHPVGSQEYVKTLGILSQLEKMKENNTPPSISKDTLAIVGANILGIFMILMHEHLHPISTKAIGLLLKPKY